MYKCVWRSNMCAEKWLNIVESWQRWEWEKMLSFTIYYWWPHEKTASIPQKNHLKLHLYIQALHRETFKLSWSIVGVYTAEHKTCRVKHFLSRSRACEAPQSIRERILSHVTRFRDTQPKEKNHPQLITSLCLRSAKMCSFWQNVHEHK